jgi:hypothetical protein
VTPTVSGHASFGAQIPAMNYEGGGMTEFRQGQAGRYEDTAGWEDVPASSRASTRTTVWSGWVWFAGVIMIMMGVLNAFEGLVALFNQQYYVVGPNNVLVLNLTGWGWLHLILGALVLLTGVALLFDAGWARVVTVILAGLNVIAQLAFIGVYPLWSIIGITLCIVIIWAVVVHGEESHVNL